jgi:hypothetical protein
MPYFANDPSLDFDAQEQAMLQQAARIKALRDMKLDINVTQPESYRSAVTGATMLAPYVKKPTLGYFAQGLQDYTGNQMEQELNRNRSALTEAEHTGLEKSLANFPQPRIEERIQAGPAGALGEPAQVTVEPTDRDRLTHAMSLYRNPQGRPLGSAIMADVAIQGPAREQAIRLEKIKEEAAARQKEADRLNAIEVARIRAKLGQQGVKAKVVRNDFGEITGFDTEDGRSFDVDGNQIAGPRLAPTTPGTLPGASGAGQGKKAGAVLKAEQDLQTKIQQSNNLIDIASRAYPLLAKNPVYGVQGALGEGWDRFLGREQSESARAAEDLDTLSGQLAALFDRGPGTITDRERDLFVKYMGDVNNRSKSPLQRKEALDKLVAHVKTSIANAQAAAKTQSQPATRMLPVGGKMVQGNLAPDGHYYVPGANGKYLQWVPPVGKTTDEED